MVQIKSSLLLAAITATTLVSAKGMERQRRQESSSKHHHRSSTATAAAAAPTSSFTGSLPASVLSIVSTITSGEGDTAATTALYSTAVAGAVNPSVSGAPALPAGEFPRFWLEREERLRSMRALGWRRSWRLELDMNCYWNPILQRKREKMKQGSWPTPLPLSMLTSSPSLFLSPHSQPLVSTQQTSQL